MARIRTIKPEFWSDEKVGGLPLACRLLFIGLWNFADDYGIIASSPLFIKSRIFLYDRDISEDNVLQWLRELEQRKMIVPCEHDGNHYYIVRNFSKHQVVNKKSQSRTVPPVPPVPERNSRRAAPATVWHKQELPLEP